MASRAQPIGLVRWLGGGAAALVLMLALGTLGAVFLHAEGPGGLGPADWAALRFTLLQATLSAALSVGLAVPLARALARWRFPGRRLLIILMGAPFILPVIVAVLGLLAVFGRGGVLNDVLGRAGFEPVSIYGLPGVLLAHVFFNLPLATRLLLQGWQAIPAERFRLAATLGFSTRDVFRWLEWPMLRAILPGAFMVIFLICLTSFAVVLALGGGPRATTIELAIYQAFRFDFDLSKAAQLATLQFAIGAAVAAVALNFATETAFGPGLDRPVLRFDAARVWLRAVDGAMILAAAIFLLAPLSAVVIAGLGQITTLPAPVWHAAARSVAVALASTAITIALALPLALLVASPGQRRGWHSRVMQPIGYLSLAASPLVIGTGLFIILFPITDPVALALPVTAVVNAVMSLPFALRILTPAIADAEADFGRLANSLGLAGLARLRLLTLPRIRAPLGFAAGLAAALSMGDLGVVALFAPLDGATLPLQLYRLMAAYRMESAAGAALLLLMLSFALFWLFDKGGRFRAHA